MHYFKRFKIQPHNPENLVELAMQQASKHKQERGIKNNMTNNPLKPCKPWKSYQQQIQLLESRGMCFEDKKSAEHIISQINYYRLSGYWYPFRQTDNAGQRQDKFIRDTNFQDVLNLYNFDKHLRLLVLQALESIEMSVRTQIAHLMGRTSPIAHLNPKSFDKSFTQYKDKKGKTSYDRWKEKFDQQIERAKKNPAIIHHATNYQAIPIWVAIDHLDFGAVSVLYTGLPNKQRTLIAQSYQVRNADVFASWLRSLNYIRNICAHHSRLWNVNIDVIGKKDHQIKGLNNLDNKRLFFYLIVIDHLLNIISKDTFWRENIKDLLLSFPKPKNNAVKVENMGFIQGFF